MTRYTYNKTEGLAAAWDKEANLDYQDVPTLLSLYSPDAEERMAAIQVFRFFTEALPEVESVDQDYSCFPSFIRLWLPAGEEGLRLVTAVLESQFAMAPNNEHSAWVPPLVRYGLAEDEFDCEQVAA